MIYIAHRGNVNGPDHKNENSPQYIENAINIGYNVEFDIWEVNKEYYLGHEKPIYKVSNEWLNKIRSYAWLHCKNFEALNSLNFDYNAFWHTDEDYVLTSYGYIWAYPKKEKIGCICVKPELDNRKIIDGLYGICSDIIEEYRSEKNII